MAWSERLEGVAILARAVEPVETLRGLPGDCEDSHSRYIEAAIDGIIVGCLFFPTAIRLPGPKFANKLNWFERLVTRAADFSPAAHRRS
jgi:exodeoxyribonuclease-3